MPRAVKKYKSSSRRVATLESMLGSAPDYAQQFYQQQLAAAQARQAQARGTLENRQAVLQGRLANGNVNERQGNRITSRLGKLGAVLNPPTTPTPTVPGAAPTPQPAPVANAGTTQDLLSAYQTPQPQGLPELGNFATQGLSRLNAIPTPSYQDMFQRWLDVANREAGRQSAAITESFGARGGRYGSDILQAQSDLRQKQTQDIGTMADTIQKGLNEQRTGEIGQLGTLGLNVAQQQQAANEAAMQRLFADFLRRTSPPPLLGPAATYSQAPGYGDTVIG